MTRGVRLYLVGSFVLVSLAGCGRGFFQSAEREPWRAEAEIACLKSGAVKETAELVRISPISGPGVCGAEFPLKVAAFGEGSSSFGFADDDLRPPAAIGNQPRWPISQPPPPSPYGHRPILTARCAQPGYGAASSGPISLTAPGVAAPEEDEIELPPEGTPASRPQHAAVSGKPIRRATARRALFAAPPLAASLPRLGPGQGNSVAAFGPVAVKPVATLACPIVSVLDRWLADSVQPAATALVRRARRRDQADLRLFLPRHERQFARAYFRTRLRQCAGYRGLHARRRPAHIGEGRLEGHAGRAGLSARRAGHRLPALHHRAGAGLQRLSLRSYPRRPDAPRLQRVDLPAGRDVRRGGRRARGAAQSLRVARAFRDGIARRRSTSRRHKGSTRKTNSRTSRAGGSAIVPEFLPSLLAQSSHGLQKARF